MATLIRAPRPAAPERTRGRRNPLGTLAVGLVVAANALLWLMWPQVVEVIATYL